MQQSIVFGIVFDREEIREISGYCKKKTNKHHTVIVNGNIWYYGFIGELSNK